MNGTQTPPRLIAYKKLLGLMIVALLFYSAIPSFNQTIVVELNSERHNDSNSTPVISAVGEGVELIWDTTFGGTDDDWAFEVIECTGGGFLVGAITYSFGSGWGDIWLIRTDASGDLLWSHTYGGIDGDYGNTILELAGGSFVIAGYTNSFGEGGYDAWLLCVDENGDHLWDQTYGDSGNDWSFDVAKCSSGGFALSGTTENYGASGKDMWLVRTDAGGNHLWNRTYGGSGTEYARSLVECDGGGFVLAGYTTSYGSGEKDAWLVRTDADGNPIWSETFGNVGNDEADSVLQTEPNEFVFSGNTLSIVAGGQQLWLVRVDENGTLIRQEEYGGLGTDYGYALTESNDGFLLGGALSASSTDFFLVCTDLLGNQLWNENWGGTSGDGCEGLVLCNDGSIVMTGHTWSYGAGGGDVWLICVDDINPPEWGIAPVDQEVEPGQPFEYWLNANDGSEIDSYWLNDTIHFNIDDVGTIRNSTYLLEGIYGVQVCANDTFGNVLVGQFTVSVSTPTTTLSTTSTSSTTTSTSGISLISYNTIVYGLALVVVVLVVLLYRKR